jgi:hypothetical protein
MKSGSMLPRLGASSGCGWRSRLPVRRVAANILNNQFRRAKKGWSSKLGVWRGFWWKKAKGKNNLKHLDVDGRIQLHELQEIG